jgi:hypothetical protein
MWQRPQGGPNKESLFSDSDFTDLSSKFTTETRRLLEAKQKPEQIRVIQNWAHNLLRQRNPRRVPDMEEFVKDEPLAEFFEKDLTKEQRDSLMTLSSDDMQRELLRLYITQSRPSPEMFHRPGEIPPGSKPGEGNGPDRHPAESHEKSQEPAKKHTD